MPFVGVGEAVPQGEGDAHDAPVEQRCGDLCAAQGPGGMRGRGSHHDGAEHLERGGGGKRLRLCGHVGLRSKRLYSFKEALFVYMVPTRVTCGPITRGFTWLPESRRPHARRAKGNQSHTMPLLRGQPKSQNGPSECDFSYISVIVRWDLNACSTPRHPRPPDGLGRISVGPAPIPLSDF